MERGKESRKMERQEGKEEEQGTVRLEDVTLKGIHI